MDSPKIRKEVALIVGPTASGKSALALELAKKQALENRKSVIINADSAQVYQDLQILSARPTVDEMQDIEHRLYGYIDGAHACSAARWANDAKIEIFKAHEKDILPVLVGGTGLYIRTLLNGISPIPEIESDIRAAIRALTIEDAYEALLKEDPISAQRLKPQDTTRIMRALEVHRSTGKTLDYWHRHMEGGIADMISLKPVILLPPREWIYERCDRRFKLMIEHDAQSEVKRLLGRNLPEDRPVMRAIGVPEVRALIEGKIDSDMAIAQAQQATRRYAKRQYTWFRNQCPVSWHRITSKINNENINNFVRLLQ